MSALSGVENLFKTRFSSSSRCLLEGGHEVGNDLVEGLVVGLGQVAVLADLVEQGLLGRLHVLHELLLEGGDLGGVDLVQEAWGERKDN